MSKEHRIEKLIDLLSLTDQEIERFIPDFLVWLSLAKAIGNDVPGLTHRAMIWVDDGLPGEVHHIDITESDGTTTRYPGPAFKDNK